MTSLELMELLNSVSDSYVADARMPVRKTHGCLWTKPGNFLSLSRTSIQTVWN